MDSNLISSPVESTKQIQGCLKLTDILQIQKMPPLDMRKKSSDSVGKGILSYRSSLTHNSRASKRKNKKS
jgi:hypothetical protein